MVKIKICGITNKNDYDALVSLGVDYTGFIFYDKSPRYIAPLSAFEIICGNKSGNKKVGVFVNESPDRIREIYKTVKLDLIQLHGDESPDYCNNLNLPYWKALRLRDERSISMITEYGCDTILIDSYNEKKYGGTGSSIELKLIEKAAAKNKKIIVAGGVSAENIAQILKIDPFGIDINSSIEISPGKKDIQKMRLILKTIKENSQKS
jgi:phosphoribosylanthranilate isomerase